MTTVMRIAALVAVCAHLAAATVNGGERLELRVSPMLSMAPAAVVIRVIIEADEDNRALDVIADSTDFYTSSRVPLNGAQSPRVSEIRFAALPEGVYQVTAILTGSQGRRAVATRFVIVGTPGGAF